VRQIRCCGYKRQSALLGLDAPTKTALTDPDGGPVQFVLKSILDVDEGPVIQANARCLPAPDVA
jgi:hypothetical protein